MTQWINLVKESDQTAVYQRRAVIRCGLTTAVCVLQIIQHYSIKSRHHSEFKPFKIDDSMHLVANNMHHAKMDLSRNWPEWKSTHLTHDHWTMWQYADVGLLLSWPTLLRIRRQTLVLTHQIAALCCVKWRHGRHLESVTSNWIKIRLCQSMRYSLKNIPAKFHPDPIWDDGVLGLFEEVDKTKTTTRRRTTRVAIWDQFLIGQMSSAITWLELAKIYWQIGNALFSHVEQQSDKHSGSGCRPPPKCKVVLISHWIKVYNFWNFDKIQQ